MFGYKTTWRLATGLMVLAVLAALVAVLTPAAIVGLIVLVCAAWGMFIALALGTIVDPGEADPPSR